MAPPDVLFLVCPDGQLINRKIATELGRGRKDTTDVERKVYWADDDPPMPDTFWQDLTVQNLFAEPKAVVLRRAQTLKVAQWDRLADGIRSKPASVGLFLCMEGEWKKGQPSIPKALEKRPIWAAAEKRGWVWREPGLDQRSIGRFVEDWAREKGMSFGNGALRALTRTLPLDARAAGLELDKIELAAGKNKVVEASYARLIAVQGEMDFFAFTDALSAGSQPKLVWERVLQDHRKPPKDQILFPLLGSLGREARMMGQILAGERPKGHPYVVKKKTPLAHRLGERGVARLFDLCLEAEWGVKTGERSTEQALDMLVSELTRLYRG